MEVILCNSCEGEGQCKVETDYRGDWEFQKCKSCNGTGRLIERSYSYTVPFDTKKELIYEYDTKIFELIRKFENKVYK